jgi:hypothetical protein
MAGDNTERQCGFFATRGCGSVWFGYRPDSRDCQFRPDRVRCTPPRWAQDAELAARLLRASAGLFCAHLRLT